MHIYLHTHFFFLRKIFYEHTYIFTRYFATYINIHAFLQGIFATYINIHAYPRYFCYLYLHTCIFARYFCYLYLHTCIFARYFCYLYQHTCIFKVFLLPISTPFWVAFFCYMFTFYSHIRTHLRVNFMPYAPILRRIFVPFSAYMHIGKALGYLPNIRTPYLPLATYSMTNISTSSRHKEPSRCSLHQMLA